MGKWTPIHAQCFREEDTTPLFWCRPLSTQLDFISYSPFKKVGSWNLFLSVERERKGGLTTLELGAVKSLVCPLHVLPPHPLQKVRGLQEQSEGKTMRTKNLWVPEGYQETALPSHLAPSPIYTLYLRPESSKKTSLVLNH